MDSDGDGVRDYNEEYFTIRTDSSGSFTAALTVPWDISRGTYMIRYSGSTSVNPVSYLVIVPALMYLDTDISRPDSIIKVNGKDFPKYESGYVYLDTNGDGKRDSDEAYISTKSSVYGEFTASLTVPNIGEGIYSIRYSGSTSVDPSSLTIDITPPGAPTVTENEITDWDTSISGKAEAGTTITVNAGETVKGTAITGSDGRFTVRFGYQKGGSALTLTATDRAGNISEGTKVTVIDITPPYAPTIYTVTDQSTEIRGNTEKYSLVKLYIAGVYQTSTTADQDGYFKFTVNKQKAGIEIMATSTDTAGNVSSARFVTVKDVTPPAFSVVNEITNQSTTVSGQTEADARITVKIGNEEYTGTSDQVGNFSIMIPTPKAGIEIVIIATDNVGNVSEPITVVVRDETAPDKPEVNEVTDKDTTVTGQAEAGSKVEVKVNGSVIGTGTAEEDGQYEVVIDVQKAGTELVIIAIDHSGNVSVETPVVVKDATAPAKPVVSTVSDRDTTISGVAEPGSTVEVKANGSLIGTGTAGQDGKYSVSIQVQKAGTVLEVIATDSEGNQSEGTTIKVIDKTAPSVLTVNTVSDKLKEVTGKTEAGATVSILIGTKIYAAKADTNGNFKVIIPAQKAGTKVIVTAEDSAGNSVAKSITVLDKTAPVVPSVTTVTDLIKVVTGKAEAGAIVTVTIGTKKYIAKADTKGIYKVTIPVQKAGTKVIVTAKDAAGNVSSAKSVIVIDKTAPLAPKIKTTVKSTTKEVSGTTEAYAAITIKFGKKVIGTAKADSKGNFKVKIKAQKKKTVLIVTATDKAKNVSKGVTVKVK